MKKKINYPGKAKFLEQSEVFAYFDEFIKDTYAGRRTRKNGKKISDRTVGYYIQLRRKLEEFCVHSGFDLIIYVEYNLTLQEKITAARYYKKFYACFIHFLYEEKRCYDNYVGLLIKGIRCFFNYLETERRIAVGQYHKSFFIPREEIPIVALTAEQLNYIIYDPSFAALVHQQKLEKIRDIFVFGCTVALRVSDLLQLSRKNLLIKGGNFYLQAKSQKTASSTSVKLPAYCVEILESYRDQYDTLLPTMTAQYFNRRLKELAVLFPDNYEFVKIREKRGRQIIVYKDAATKTHFKLSDHITSHTMRRTAITTMLNLGMPEHLVRRISGHAPNSKEFYRYVQLSQHVIDNESDKVFEKLKNLHAVGKKYRNTKIRI